MYISLYFRTKKVRTCNLLEQFRDERTTLLDLVYTVRFFNLCNWLWLNCCQTFIMLHYFTAFVTNQLYFFSDGKEKAKIPDTKVRVAGSETVPATGEAGLCRFVPRRHLADLALLVLGETRDVKLCSNYIKESISPIPMYVDSMSKDKCVDPGLR